MNDLLTLQEAADILRVHTRTIVRWHRAGLLHMVRLGKAYRIESSEIERIKRNGIRHEHKAGNGCPGQ